MAIRKQTISTFSSAFAGKRVVVTGHTGFKGSWLSLWLAELGAEVFGYGLPPVSAEGLYPFLKKGVFQRDQHGNIVDQASIEAFVEDAQPDFVFHLAAQPLVRLSYHTPIDTLTTNIVGSAQVLEAVRKIDKNCTTIFVTSDKCYQNREWCYSYRENDPLGGKDPYSMSKAGAELVAECWRRSFFDRHPHQSRVISVRAGNVIGGGDYSADRLIPDCVRAAMAKQPLTIRSPKATRPWQHVLDCLHGYLVAAVLVPQMPATPETEAFNFGPQDPHDHPVAEVADAFFQAWQADTPGVQVAPAEPSLAESVYLAVAIDKAQRLLGWQPVWSFETAVQLTADWYCARHLHDQDMLAVSRSQLQQFTQAALER